MFSWSKAIGWTAGVGAAGLLFGACAGGATNDPEAAQQQQQSGGLAVGQAGYPDEADRKIEVSTLDSMKYEPDSITVEEGETIHFVITNEGKLPHEFTLGDEAAQEEHSKEMGGGMTMAHDHPFAVYLEPGQTKELTWNFTNPGEFIYGCHVPGHYDAGMKAPVIVE
jgi:uncharacterized cupredoxin-like copper-binding protein